MSVPLALFGAMLIAPLTLLLLIAAPSVATLLQLGLSRTREYSADIGAAELTHDPRGLASALAKLERYQSSGWLGWIFADRGRSDPLLRTHPHTHERIKRLLSLSSSPELYG